MINTIRVLATVAFCALAGFVSSVQAQSVGGNASLSVSSVSANVQIPLPNNKAQYPSVILVPSPATTQEIFYAFGSTNAVTATAGTSAALPAGGICLNLGPGSYVAAVTSTGTGTLRISQASGCTTFSGSSQASSAPDTAALGLMCVNSFGAVVQMFSSDGTYNCAGAVQTSVAGVATASNQSVEIGLLTDLKNGAIPACTTTPVFTPAAAATLLVRNTQGTLCLGQVVNQSASDGYLIAYNSATIPSTGALTGAKVLDCVRVPAYGNAALGGSLGNWDSYSAGVVLILSASSDCFTYTPGITGYLKGRSM